MQIVLESGKVTERILYTLGSSKETAQCTKNSKRLIRFCTATVLTCLGQGIATADTAATSLPKASNSIGSSEKQSDGAQKIKKGAEELEHFSLPRYEEKRNGETYIVYTTKDQRHIGVPKNMTDEDIAFYISAGPALKGPWIEFTPKEQQVLVAGGSAALATTICGATEGIGCGLAETIVASASAWVGANGGICNNKRLLIETTWAGTVRGAQCR